MLVSSDDEMTGDAMNLMDDDNRRTTSRLGVPNPRLDLSDQTRASFPAPLFGVAPAEAHGLVGCIVATVASMIQQRGRSTVFDAASFCRYRLAFSRTQIGRTLG